MISFKLIKTVNDVFFTNQIIFDQWYDNVKNFVFFNFWSYFDSETIFIYSILNPSEWPACMVSQNTNIFVTLKTRFQSSQKTLQKKTISQIELDKRTNIFYKKHSIYKKTKRDYNKYFNAKIKKKNQIHYVQWKKNIVDVHIEFFVEYVFINVYHIWISHK